MNINIFFSTKLFFVLFIGIGITFNSWAQRPTCPRTAPGATMLIPNGDFEGGDVGFVRGTGFGTEASPCNAQLGNDRYAICTNPNPLNSGFFRNMGDHTTGTGNMFVIDFADAPNPNPVLTYPNIPVTANVSYFFSAWFANIAINNDVTCPECPSGTKIRSSPILRFQIERSSNNQVLYTETINVDSLSNNWNEFSTDFAANFTGDITIKIFNLRQGNGSNDLALDDISFKLGCDGIQDLSKVGKTSALQKTVYTCNESFEYILDTQLDNSRYAFNWYEDTNPNNPLTTGIDLATPNSSVGPGPTYSVLTAPTTNNKKYYVCYDSLGDGVTCARLDSVVFVNQFNVDLGPNTDLCPPINYTINPAITSNQVTYEWFLNPSTPVGSGSTYTATSAGQYRLKVTHANNSCMSPDRLITITERTPAFTGSITRPCNESGDRVGGIANLLPTITGSESVTKINNLVSVEWYKDNTSLTPVASSLNTATGETTVSTNALDTTNVSCPQGGLYLEDKNSFQTSLMSTTPCSPASFEPGQGTKFIVKFTSDVPFSLNSIDLFPKWDDGVGESVTYQMKLYNGAMTSEAVRASPAPTPAYVGLEEAFFGANSDNQVKKVTLNGPSDVPAGTYYLRIDGYKTTNPSQSKEYYSRTCNAPSSSFSDPEGVFEITNVYRDGNNNLTTGPTVPAFINNLKIQVGNANSCGRVWVCASCVTVTPVTYTYFNLFPTGDSNVMLTWGTAQETNNQKFVIEFSHDGVNFTPVGEVLGSDNSRIKKDYSFVHNHSSNKQYYRIKQIDHDGKFAYTPVKYVTLTGNDWIQSVYPQPVKQGESLNIQVNSLHDDHVSIKVTDIEGHTVLHNDLDVVEGGDYITLNTSSMRPGVYILSLSTVESVKMVKIVIE